MKPELSRLVLVLVAVLAGTAHGAPDAVLGTELQRWVDETAASLGETLSRHPRFSGETIGLSAVSAATSGGHSNALAEAIARRLRQRLLEVEGLRLAVDQPRSACAPPRRIDYLVRLEVVGSGREARVHVAVVDVAESVWVSGISHRWQGRLTAAERGALQKPVSGGTPGTIDHPLALADADAVAAALKGDLQCTLANRLDGSMHVVTPQSRPLARVGLALRSELMFEPLAATAPTRDEARWLLTLNVEDGQTDVRELYLTLTDSAGEQRQRLASVFVSGVAATPPPQVATTPLEEPVGPSLPPSAPSAPEPSATVAPSGLQPGPGLLSLLEMRRARAEGICQGHGDEACVEFSFGLRDAAYLFVLSTRDHGLTTVPCEPRLARADAGPHRYRMAVPAARAGDGSQPSVAGFYVLAVREFAVAQQLRDALGMAPGSCRQTAPAGDAWLVALEWVLARHPQQIAWRASHVAVADGHVVPVGPNPL